MATRNDFALRRCASAWLRHGGSSSAVGGTKRSVGVPQPIISTQRPARALNRHLACGQICAHRPNRAWIQLLLWRGHAQIP